MMTQEKRDRQRREAEREAKVLSLFLLLPGKRVEFRLGRFYIDGRSVSIKTIREYIKRIETRLGKDVRELVDDLENDKISTAAFQREFERKVTSSHILAGALAVGSIEAAVKNADVQERIASELEYADKFVKQMREKKAGTFAQIASRAVSYLMAAAITYGIIEQLVRRLLGKFTECRRIRRASESCPGCIEWSYRWVKIAEMPPIGSLQCQSHCRCYLEYRDGSSSESSGEPANRDSGLPSDGSAIETRNLPVKDAPSQIGGNVKNFNVLSHKAITVEHRVAAALKTQDIKNPTVRQWAEDAYAQAIANGVKVPEIASHSFKGNKASAMFSPSNNKIFVNTKLNAKSDAVFEANVKSGWLTQKNPVLHELGHKVHSDALGNAYDNAKNIYLSDAQKALIKEQVSGYAAVNPVEFAAEVWSGVASGKTYSDEIMLLFKRVTDGKVILRGGSLR